MVVEYVGETVRRSVVGLREAAEYDARCGSGTYVFGMSATSGLCTDATRVGARVTLPSRSSLSVSAAAGAWAETAHKCWLCLSRQAWNVSMSDST